MEIYYYCSYEGSAVGYHIGTVKYPAQSKGRIKLSSENIDPFIQQCFESRLVKSAFGRIPKSRESEVVYFLLLKRLKKKGCWNKGEIEYYMNVAITCNDWKEFKKLADGEESEGKELSEAIFDSIYIDEKDDFGYYVKADKLSDVVKLIGKNIDGLKKCIYDVEKNEIFYIELISSGIKKDEIMEKFQLQNVGGKKWECENKDSKLIKWECKKSDTEKHSSSKNKGDGRQNNENDESPSPSDKDGDKQSNENDKNPSPKDKDGDKQSNENDKNPSPKDKDNNKLNRFKITNGITNRFNGMINVFKGISGDALDYLKKKH